MIAEPSGPLLLSVVKKEIARILQMICHEARRQFRVALFNGKHDRSMELQSMFEIDKLRSDRDHVQHGPVNCMKEPSCKAVSRCLKNCAVEVQIRRDKTNPITAAAFKVRDRLPEQRDILRVCAFCGLGREGRFDHQPHLSQLLRRDIVKEKKKLHGDGKNQRCILVEIASVSYLLRDDSHQLEDFQSGSQ